MGRGRRPQSAIQYLITALPDPARNIALLKRITDSVATPLPGGVRQALEERVRTLKTREENLRLQRRIDSSKFVERVE
jgi:hypothetical protein